MGTQARNGLLTFSKFLQYQLVGEQAILRIFRKFKKMFTTECNFSKITAFKLETLQKTNFINSIVVIFMWMNFLKNFRTAISQDTSPRLLLLVKNTSRVFYWHVLSENFLIFIFIILFLFLYSFPFFTLSFSLQIIFYYFDLYLKFLIFK